MKVPFSPELKRSLQAACPSAGVLHDELLSEPQLVTPPSALYDYIHPAVRWGVHITPCFHVSKQKIQKSEM